MKYVLEQKKGDSVYAGVKAPRDIGRILNSVGYKTLYYSDVSSKIVLWRHIISFIMILRLCFRINVHDVYFIQWPLYTRFNFILYVFLKWKKPKIYILIHDLKSIRYGKSSYMEKKFLNLAEVIISHTDKMKQYLVMMGIMDSKIQVLNSFDYLISESKTHSRHLSYNVVYAGNLKKSSFLEKIKSQPLHFPIFCYGGNTMEFSGDLIYKGFFSPDNVSDIEGSWGLVWDGDSIDTCSGVYGQYLKVNSPHKLSLYIVSRLPVIVWRESALANYVEQKKIGFLISSLNEIPEILKSISETEYELYLANVDKERSELVSGLHLKKCIDGVSN